MAEITVDLKLECSECGMELELSNSVSWLVSKIDPCKCQEEEKEDLNNKIEYLKEKILEMKEEFITNNQAND